MMYECVTHQVTSVGGDANKLAYQKAGQQWNASSSLSTCQFWMDRMEHALDIGLLLEEQIEDQHGHECNTVPFHLLFGLAVSS